MKTGTDLVIKAVSEDFCGENYVSLCPGSLERMVDGMIEISMPKITMTPSEEFLYIQIIDYNYSKSPSVEVCLIPEQAEMLYKYLQHILDK